jgi:hypothetical protein
MIKKHNRIASIIALVFIGITIAQAEEPLSVKWEDLAPAKQFEDPYEKLSQQQLQELGYLVRIRRLIAARKIPGDGIDAEQAMRIERKLQADGVDVFWLISLRDQVRRMRESQAKSVQSHLEGKVVRLAGFIVPVEKQGNLVTKFLLTKDFDPCTHATASPAPNQTVLVRSDEGVVSEGRLIAVCVTGRMVSEATQWVVPRKDRPMRFTAAYAITPDEIEVHAAKR